ncbi:hypothetical protein DID88_009577 [Monilinia fructigena]|uniref:Uncharacterized protein n=1 Tax=Monilinia fructigena TaxID=38457 RepID=A0A395IPN8_9HELO|nr:hypothetical protein DID88_009577 [Monilinia fructigena]
MLTMLRVPSRGEGGSETTEEIVRDGYPYYFKKNNGRMVMARRISGRRESKNFSLLGQAFGIREPKKASSVDVLKKKKKKKKPVPSISQLQAPFSAPLSQQHLPNYPNPLFAPIIPQQPFADPNIFFASNPGYPPVYSMPGFPPPLVPVSAPAQPVRWAFKEKAQAPSVEELLKVESDFLKRTRSKSQKSDGEHNDHTEIKTTTTTNITKHICVKCRRDRSAKYHLEHPLKAGEASTPGFCRRCRRKATSTSGSSSNDSDEGGPRRNGDGGRGRRGEMGSKKNDRRHPKSRLHSVEVLSREDRRGTGRFNDYRDEIIVEEEVVHEREARPRDQSRRSYNRTREGDLAEEARRFARTRKENIPHCGSSPRKSKVRIDITNRSLSATSPSLTYETEEKFVHFNQPAERSNYSQTASARDLCDQYNYIEPLRSVTSVASLPKATRVSKESVPSLRTRNHAQRRRSERAYPEQTYDRDVREQGYKPLPRHRLDEDVIIVETEHEQPRSRHEPRNQRRPRPRPSGEEFIFVETDHEDPRIWTESRGETRKFRERRRSPRRAPVKTRETYITSEIDQHGNKTQYKWTASSSNSSPPPGFIPSIHRPSTNIRHYSDSSEEYQRALALAYDNLPGLGSHRRSHRRPRNLFESSGGGFDGADTLPEVPDPPTDKGFWEPRNACLSTRGTKSRGGHPTPQSHVPRVPQHQSTSRGFDQPWRDASSIDQRNQCQEQHNKPLQSRFSDSRTSSGSMITQSDSLRTISPTDSPEVDTNSTARSMVPRPVSVRETTDSGNEVESTTDTPSPKAIITKKPADKSHRQNDHPDARVSNTKGKNHGADLASQKGEDNLGSLASCVEYVHPNERICSADKAVTNDDDVTTFDDATDLTLRTARSMAEVNARINARRVSFAESDQFEPTPEQSRKKPWGANNNTNNNDGQSWNAQANDDQPWGENANTNGDDSWGTTTSNDFWSPNDATESVFLDVGSYSGPPTANASKLDRGATTKTSGFDYTKGFGSTTKTKSGNVTGGDGNDDNGEGGGPDAEDEWGPIPTFSSLNI